MRSIALNAVTGTVLLLSLTGAFGQQSIVPVIGTVRSISAGQITIETGGPAVRVATDRRTQVWKGRLSRNLSLVEIGDDVSARCRTDESGRLIAELLELNVVNYFGVITKVDGTRTFEILTNPNADPQSAYIKKRLPISIDKDTVFSASSPEDLKPGREVQMTGLDLRNGTVRASRVTVYEDNRPVRMGSGKVMPVTPK